MRVSQSTFSLVHDLPDEQIRRQIAYALGRRWAVSIEHTDEPHHPQACWETWGAPAVGSSRTHGVMEEVKACRAAYPERCVRVVAFDAARGSEKVHLVLPVQPPRIEPGFELVRRAAEGRRVRYAIRTVRRAARRAS
jgi:ribulose-bisphosphate carboxylase small chain